MTLIAPPPIVGPRDVAPPPVGPAADAAVPGAEVYHLPPWFALFLKGLWPRPVVPVPSPVPVPVPTPAPHVVPYPAAIVEALNGERGKHGLAALECDVPLCGVSHYWAGQQAEHGRMSHGPGTSFATRIWSVHPHTYVGECVAEGYPDVPAVVAGWMNSPPHREIVLGDFTACGAGVAYGRDGTAFWCADFLRPA